MSTNPIHSDPANTGNQSTAPYNFIPLPEKVLTATAVHGTDEPSDLPWLNHHRVLDGHHSGHIDISIETLTPTFTRGAHLPDENEWDDSESRQRPDPMMSSGEGGVPVLPGSSIRGAIRSLFEILTFSKLTPVTDKTSFYRTLPPARIGKFYTETILKGHEKPQAGFLRETSEGWTIEPAEVLQVPHVVLSNAGIGFRYEQRNPNYTPQRKLHGQEVWFNRGEKDKASAVYPDERGGASPGRLVLTGAAPKKKHEFIFVEQPNAAPLSISQEVWDEFHSDRQLSKWQQERFPQGQDNRLIAGAAAEGDPVFYLSDNGTTVNFFGRARMFRMPYDISPAGRLSDEHSPDAPIDLTEAVFGTVSGERIVKGRVSFSTAVATGKPPDGEWFEPEFVPKLLSSPKPTCYPHYIVQDGNRGPEEHTTYLKKDTTTLRGHKLYWHRPTASPKGDDSLRASVLSGAKEGRMHTVIKPVKRHVTFHGRIRFSNLTDVELGALMAAINLPAGHAHRIGMAKSLGLGSVRLNGQLKISDPAQRYRRPKTDASQEPSTAVQQCAEAFESLIAKHCETTGELTTDRKGLRKISRLDSLYLMLDHRNAPASDQTEHLDLASFRNRRVLPTPNGVMGQPSPTVPFTRRPLAAESDYRPPGRSRPGPGNRYGQRGGRSQTRKPRIEDKRPKGTVTMTVSESTTKKGAPILEHKSGRYVFSPGSAPSEMSTPGTAVPVEVRSPSSGPNLGQVIPATSNDDAS